MESICRHRRGPVRIKTDGMLFMTPKNPITLDLRALTRMLGDFSNLSAGFVQELRNSATSA